MKKILTGILVAMAMVFTTLQAATVELAEGTDVLSAAISAAADGDVIVLTTDGGVYAESAKLSSITQGISIIAAPGLTNKPILRVTTGGDYVFKLTATSGLFALDGIEVDGTAGTGSAENKYVLRVDNGDSTDATLDISVTNCNLHDFKDRIIKVYPLAGATSVVVDNCIFADGASEGVCLYDGSSSTVGSFIQSASITNCTFRNIAREAVHCEQYTGTQVVVDHCTFDNIGVGGLKSMIRFRDAEQVEVKNSIFTGNMGDGDKFIDLASATSKVTNISVWDVANFDIGNATVGDTTHMDPGYADAANADYSIATDSPLMTFGDDGGPIGDMRWITMPEVTVIPVAAGTDVLSAAISSASDGDVIELTTDGGIYSESAKFSSITKAVTIRAAEGMINKPVLSVTTGGDYIFKLTLSTGLFALQGIEVDGTAGTGSAENKYLLRVDNGDSTDATVNISVVDCNIHDFKDRIIKVYPLAGAKSIVVDNCIFSDGASEGVCLYDGSSSTVGSFIQAASITNSTFRNIAREAVHCEQYTGTQVMVDRCTFDNIGVGGLKSMIRFRDAEQVMVKNSIFTGNQGDGDKFIDLASVNSKVTNISVWDVANFDIGNATVGDTTHADPGYANAATGDYSLPDGSALLTFADDGGAIGDPRWTPGAPAGFLLKVNVSGRGSVAIDPDLPAYEAGSSVTLTATPYNELWQFVGWDPMITFPPNNPVATVQMNDNMIINALFEPVAAKYTVNISSVGLGHVDTLKVSDYEVPGFYAGDSIVFTAVADTVTWEFAYWADAAGDSFAVANPLSWIADSTRDFVAHFRSKLTQFAFADSVIGRGSFTVSPSPVPGFNTYDIGTVLTLQAKAAGGWLFAGWQGDLTGTDDSVEVTLNADMAVTAEFTEIPVPDGILVCDASWNMLDIIDFAKYNTQVKKVLLTQVGPYAPTEDMRSNGKLPQLDIDFPLIIEGSDTISNGKATIKGWAEGGSEGLFRLRADGRLTLNNVLVDGNFSATAKTKYIFRAGGGSDDPKDFHIALLATNTDFTGTLECFYKNYAGANVDSMIFRNCTVSDIGKEGIYDQALGTAKRIEISNCSFWDVNREVFRLKIWQPEEMLVDHVTVYNCGLESNKYSAFKLEQSAAVRIQNCIISDVLNTGSNPPYAVRMYGPDASIDNILLSPNSAGKIDDNAGSVNGPDIFWYDVMFTDAANHDFTLKDSSVAYHMANDGSAAVGDLRWATSTNVADYTALNLSVDGPGTVTLDPLPMAKFYNPGTSVSLTAVPDTLMEFKEWGGALSGSDLTASLTMDADKAVTATFIEPVFTAQFCVNMSIQIRAGLFNPATDTVDCAGSFGEMGAKNMVMNDDDADSIYTMELKFGKHAGNRQANFLFRINGVAETRKGNGGKGANDRIVDVNSDTSFVYFYDDIDVLTAITDMVPMAYALNQNYPNPFNPITTIPFALKDAGLTRLVVYDVLGREVAVLVNRQMSAGFYSVDLRADRLASGVYFYKLTSGKYVSVKKLMVLK